MRKLSINECVTTCSTLTTYLSCNSVWVSFNSDLRGRFYFTFHWIYIIQTNVIYFERNLFILCLSMCQKIKETSLGKGFPCTPLLRQMIKNKLGKILLHLTPRIFLQFDAPHQNIWVATVSGWVLTVTYLADFILLFMEFIKFRPMWHFRKEFGYHLSVNVPENNRK